MLYSCCGKNMKKKFLNNSMKEIRNKFPEYNDDKLEEIEYGLEAIYIVLTKTVVIFALAIILNIFREVFFTLLFYNLLRTTAFGMHAKKSSHCYILSSIFFLGGGLICKYIDINLYLKLILGFISLIFLILYAPADTYNRPLINKKKRIIYKTITIINGLIYFISMTILNKHIISDYLFLGLLEASLMIHPFTYRMFQLPYNNYKNYNTSYN